MTLCTPAPLDNRPSCGPLHCRILHTRFDLNGLMPATSQDDCPNILRKMLTIFTYPHKTYLSTVPLQGLFRQYRHGDGVADCAPLPP